MASMCSKCQEGLKATMKNIKEGNAYILEAPGDVNRSLQPRDADEWSKWIGVLVLFSLNTLRIR